MSNNIESLKLYIRRYLNTVVPGYIHTIDSYSYRKYGLLAIDLFLTDPIKLYDILMEYYRDSLTADFALQKFFLRPLAIKIGDTLLEEKLLQLIKQGRVDEVKEILKKIMSA